MKNNGFTMIRARELPELSAKLIEYTHDKTGARVAYLDREDENKAFSIAFKTLPTDSTGVFHILEHSVLCGSRKYPIKEPFVELLKSSVQTFLNAFTAADKTVYPVSSRNEKDFMNLMDVYLDAVFHPAIYGQPSIFRQEGWRLEEEGLSGVVLNEMRGNFASPGAVLSREMNRLLFPDNCYRFVSGGDPDDIPNLTYEAFITAHKKHYHPSNAYISIVGTMDIDAVLSKLDSYLSEFDRRDDDFVIPMQQPTRARTVTVPYAAESEDDGAIVSFASLITSFDDKVKNYAVSLLAEYLTGDDDAPLKRAVLDNELAQDFAVSLHDGIQQTWVSLDAFNTDAENVGAIRATVREALESISNNGIDRERLHACYNNYAFAMREPGGGMPQSVSFAMDMLDTWLYRGDPAEGLLVDGVLDELKSRLDTDYFPNLIKEIFLDNAHFQTVVLVPRADIEEKEFAFENEEQFLAETERMYAWQAEPDTEEALASIPKLSLSDLSEKPEPLAYSDSKLHGATVLRHSVKTKTALVHAHFNASDLPAEELHKLALALRLLGSMGTKKHDRSQLPLAAKNAFGKLDFYQTVIEGENGARLMLTASFACLTELTGDCFGLLAEMLLDTDWSDVSLLREQLLQMDFGARFSVPAEGHNYAMLRAGSHVSHRTAANELMGGMSFIEKIGTLAKANDEELTALLGDFESILRRVITRERLTLSVSDNVGEKEVDTFVSMLLSRNEVIPCEANYIINGEQKEGIAINADVGFAAMAGSLKTMGMQYHGSMAVLGSILDYTHLWNGIRIAGGAYGCGFSAIPTGELFIFSYRDPDPKNSLGVFNGSGAFIREYMKDEPDLTGYVLSSVSSVDPLRTPEQAVSAAETRFFMGMTNADAEHRYNELIHTSAADLTALADMLDRFAQEGFTCVSARADALNNCGIAEENVKDIR